MSADVRTWLAARTPAPPESLIRRMNAHLAHSTSTGMAAALLESAHVSLRGLLPHGCLERADAHELLAADALVTYAFEAAAEDPSSLRALAAESMRALSATSGAA